MVPADLPDPLGAALPGGSGVHQTRHGYRLATSNGGVLSGQDLDLILIDDPSKPEEALSDARRNATNDWSLNTLYSRLYGKCRGAIVIIMQRLHEDDLVGDVRSHFASP